jgi:DNA-binding transcriptional LysR family regulator
MDTFQALRVAAAVQRAGSFSGAARQLGVSPAAVAKLVAQLESRLGLRLFDRTTHDLSVTGEGRDLLARLAAPLREVDDALASGRSAKLASGAVKVSVPASFARMAVIPALATFQQQFPDVQLDLRLENRRVDLVAEGYDCGIGASLAPDSTLVARPLATLWPVLCASPAYLAAHGEPRRFADLAAHRCIVMRSDTTGRLRPWELSGRSGRGRQRPFEPPSALQLTDPESIAAAAIANCGIALVGVHHVAQAIVDGRLVRVLKDLHGARFQIVIYYAKRRLLPQRTRAFVDHVLATVPACEALQACQRAMGEQGN